MPADLTLQSLPLFPLGSVLFPGGLLPLRIFEVRYLDMIRRCQAAGAPFGVVGLTEGHEVRQPGAAPERFAGIGTLATLAQVQQPQAGLMLVQAQASQRFRIERSERLPHGLWVADVTLLPDDRAVPVPEDLQETAQALGQVLEQLRKAADEAGAQLPVRMPWQLEDCAWVANRWCELLPLPTSLKQQLMALDNPLLRLELVADQLARSGISPRA